MSYNKYNYDDIKIGDINKNNQCIIEIIILPIKYK